MEGRSDGMMDNLVKREHDCYGKNKTPTTSILFQSETSSFSHQPKIQIQRNQLYHQNHQYLRGNLLLC